MVRMWGHNRGNDVGLEGGDEKEGTWERKKEWIKNCETEGEQAEMQWPRFQFDPMLSTFFSTLHYLMKSKGPKDVFKKKKRGFKEE